MNAVQQELYFNLMKLCSEDEAFFYSDQVLNEGTGFGEGHFRIFNYRLASYTQWLKPGALECRGVMFLMDDKFEMPLALVSWPFEKFFNLNENPMTMFEVLPEVVAVQDKMDGSLISTFYFDGRVHVKSKGSLHSDQAVAALKLLESSAWGDLYRAVEHHVMVMDHTVIMEYTAPDNRIVVPSESPSLTVLSVRDNHTGEYVDRQDWHEYLDEFSAYDCLDDVHGQIDQFVADIPKRTGIEGFVLTLANGQRVKVKTDWYCALHHLKDSINSQRRLFEAAVNDATDDLRAQFYDDPQAISIITDMETKVASIYNHIVDQVERFYERNKHLERKDYAIKGQKELDKLCFGLAMSKYTGKAVDYKATLIKHRKNFGIKDDPEVVGE